NFEADLLSGINETISIAVCECGSSEVGVQADFRRAGMHAFEGNVGSPHPLRGQPIGERKELCLGPGGEEFAVLSHGLVVVAQVGLACVVTPSRLERTISERHGLSPRQPVVVGELVGGFGGCSDLRATK